MSKYEITVSQFANFIHNTGYLTDAEKGQSTVVLRGDEWLQTDTVNWRHDTKGDCYSDYKNNNYPVIHVSWNDAMAFCKWMSDSTYKYFRLPTEAEWEYAAKGGSKHSQTTAFGGSNNIDEVGWYIENTDVNQGVMQVGLKKPNELKLYDMTGNVWEWCYDWYQSSYDENDTQNPQGPVTGKRRTSRGGSWRTSAEPQSHVTHRNSLAPEKQGNLLGFRIVCENCFD